jgi:CheY-like chemotaxis protein/DNA-binding CsgD family transcriptional regulator
MQKILIADDEPLNISLYEAMLKDTGYSILRAIDGNEAVSLTNEELPDLIILDWNMPRLNGLDALREIKKERITAGIPVIMITGVMTTSVNLNTAFQEGAIDFLRKPFDRIELIARVNSILMLSRTMRTLEEKFRELESSHIFIQSLIQNVNQPLVYYTPDGMVIGCNSRFEEVMGITGSKIYSTLIYRLFPPECSAQHLNADMDMLRNGGKKTYEGKSNDDQIFLFSKTLFYDVSSEPQGIICLMTNITQIKKAHAEIMENKKRELVSSALRLIQVNEMNNQLISELGKLNAFTNKEGSERIRQIIRQYSVTAGEGVWKDFEIRFEQVYEVFYKRLREQFPDLTPGEQKLCALLRLNVSSKDIAAITFQNPQSVDMARYRLRKKLNLNNDENLVDFLMKIDSV